jgi:hypothetical protein
VGQGARDLLDVLSASEQQPRDPGSVPAAHSTPINRSRPRFLTT